MDAPERIWAHPCRTFWTTELNGAESLTEYVRADLYARLAAENERLKAGQGGISIILPDPCRSQVEIDEFISKMKLEHPDITEKEEAELRRGYAVGMVFFRNTTSGNGFISAEIENAKFIEKSGYGVAFDRVVFHANRKGGEDGE